MAVEERLGQKLKELRESRGLSQQKAAAEAGLSRFRLDELEKGRSRSTGSPTRPTRATIKNLARVYDFDADALLLLAGYAPEQGNLSDAESTLLGLYRQLDEKAQELVIKMLLGATKV